MDHLTNQTYFHIYIIYLKIIIIIIIIIVVGRL